MTLGKYRKSVVAAATALVTIVAVALQGHLIPEKYIPYAVGVITVAGALGVYRMPNDKDVQQA